MVTPSIAQVLPQTIAAGSQTTTLKVTGSNFPAQIAILWNGAAIATTVVDANTLYGTIGSSSLTTPATVQLQVQNTQTMQESQAVPVTIAPASTDPSAPLAITSTALPQGVVSTAYTVTLAAAGGTSPYTWSVTTGQLPAGLSLAAKTGIISGTPTAAGNYTVGVTATDSSSTPQSAKATLALSVAAAPTTVAPLTINSSSIPTGTIGTAYSSHLQASGGTTPYTWSITVGSLPAGLSLAANTGVISGTPTVSGSYSFGVTATDSSSPTQSASTPVDLNVNGSGTTFSNLQRGAGWKSSGQLAPNYSDCIPSCPGVTWSMLQGITSPSLSGDAAEFNVGGLTPYSDALFFNQLIGSFSTQGLPDNDHTIVSSARNFTYDAYFYLPDAPDTQAMEFDINWFLNSVGITWGTECRIRGGHEWDVWDNVAGHWNPTGFACNPLQNAWNHVTVTAQRGPNNTVIYESITLNGVVNNINKTYAPFTVPSNWFGITVNYQMDGDENQTAIKSYLDNFSFTYQ